MNEKFFALPQEKQNRILNAGYRVFSLNSYKKSPMSEIAEEAGISKSLLFHYFRNKKELYLYLWDRAIELGKEYIIASGCYEMEDFFDMMKVGAKSKVELMRQFPYIGVFAVRAYYEKDPEIMEEIQQSYHQVSQFSTAKALKNVKPENFLPGLDLKAMCQQMYWTSEGYMFEMIQGENIDVDRLERDSADLVEFWRKIFGNGRKKENCEGGQTV